MAEPVAVCSECGNDDGPYGGLCLDCRLASHHEVAVASVRCERSPDGLHHWARDAALGDECVWCMVRTEAGPPRWAEVVAP